MKPQTLHKKEYGQGVYINWAVILGLISIFLFCIVVIAVQSITIYSFIQGGA